MGPDLSLVNFSLGPLETRNSCSSFNYSYPTTLRIPTVEGSDARNGVKPPAPRQTDVFVEHRQGERQPTGSPWAITELSCIDRLYPRGTLPNDVLVYIFKFYLDQHWKIDAWHTLVHVCQSWRHVVFSSPRYLNLRLLCTPRRPVMASLNIWPALPLLIEAVAEEEQPPARVMGDMANTIAALMQHNRVSKINIRAAPNSLSAIFASMNEPFPSLTELEIVSRDKVAPVAPDSFLGGFAPRLRSLRLAGIAFLALPKLLSSTSGLVDLGLWNAPNSGYLSPGEMASCLSALTRLNRFCLHFQFPGCRVDRASRHAPPLTRIILPTLTTLEFEGDSEYLEVILSRIDAPLLSSVKITFFHQPIFDTPLLRHLISRTEAFKAINRAKIDFSAFGAEVTFFREGTLDTLKLGVACEVPDWQLSTVAQFCISSIPPMPTLEQLVINGDRVQLWEDDIGAPEWLELLLPFASVKYLVLSKNLVHFYTPALEELASGSGAIELLPMLQHLSLDLEEPWLPGAVRREIKKFIAARQRFGHPVTVNAAGLGPITDGALLFDECELFGIQQ